MALEVARSWPPETLYLDLDLERPADRLRLQDADGFLRAQGNKLVILDEIHRLPGLFEVLRGIIDERRRAGQRFGHFLLLGSASLDLMQQSSETLAGRVSYLEIVPINALELQGQGIDTDVLWLRGGFPDSLLAPDDRASLDWREDFVRSYLERDVPMFAPRLPAETISRLWTMLAHQQGALLQQSRLASSLGLSSPAVERYIDLVLEKSSQPWMAVEIKRSTAPTLSKGFDIACEDLGITHRHVVYPGTDQFPMRQGATAISLTGLMEKLQKED